MSLPDVDCKGEAENDDDFDSICSVDSLEEERQVVRKRSCEQDKDLMYEKCVLSSSAGDTQPIGTCTESRVERSDKILIPFYSGQMSLQEIKLLQCNARKKVVNATKKRANCQLANDRLISLDRLSTRTDSSFHSTKSEYKDEDTKSNCSWSECCKRSEQCTKEHHLGSSQRSRLPTKSAAEIKSRGKSASYLEQYRRRNDLNSRNNKCIKGSSRRTDHSIVGNCWSIATHLSDISDGSLPNSSTANISVSVEEEDFYRNIINNNNHNLQQPISNSSSQYNSCDEYWSNSAEMDAERNESIKGTAAKQLKNCVTTRSGRSRVKKNQVEVKVKCDYVDMMVSKVGFLGPDLEKVKDKLDAFVRRKEYGNNASCKNRLHVQQRRQQLQIAETSQTKEEYVAVVNLTVDSTIKLEQQELIKIDNNKLNEIEKKEKRKCNRRVKTKSGKIREKGKSTSEADTQAVTTQLLLKRHELEKIMADNIRNHF